MFTMTLRERLSIKKLVYKDFSPTANVFRQEKDPQGKY